jgi:hypothetical protein
MLRHVLAAMVALCSFWPMAAGAQTPEEKETARSLMDAGHQRLDDGDLLGALDAFQSADAIMRVPTTGLARGKVLERLGRLTEAVDVLRRSARHPAEPGESQAFTEARAEAAKLDKAIAERIPSVVILVEGPAPSDVRLEVDGRPIDEAAVGMPLRLDPGRHTIRITAARHLPEEREVKLQERETRRLEVTLRRDPNASDPALPDPGLPDPAPRPAPIGGDDPGRVPTVSIVAFAVAGAGVVAGAITGGLSLAKVGDLEDACPTKTNCSSDLASDHDAMLALANASNASFAIAGAATLVGIVTLFVIDESEGAVSAAVGPSGASLSGRF